MRNQIFSTQFWVLLFCFAYTTVYFSACKGNSGVTITSVNCPPENLVIDVEALFVLNGTRNGVKLTVNTRCIQEVSNDIDTIPISAQIRVKGPLGYEFTATTNGNGIYTSTIPLNDSKVKLVVDKIEGKKITITAKGKKDDDEEEVSIDVTIKRDTRNPAKASTHD